MLHIQNVYLIFMNIISQVYKTYIWAHKKQTTAVIESSPHSIFWQGEVLGVNVMLT